MEGRIYHSFAAPESPAEAETAGGAGEIWNGKFAIFCLCLPPRRVSNFKPEKSSSSVAGAGSSTDREPFQI